jgi:hypothetical protein
MTDLIFSTLVGFATYSLLSWLIYQPKPKTNTTTKAVTIAPTIVNAVDEEVEVECDLWDTAEVAIAIAEIEPVETIEADETAKIDETIVSIEATEATEVVEVVEPIAVVEADETVETVAVFETTLTLVNNYIDLDKLPVGICKKVAGKLSKKAPELRISQTVNGTSKPVSQLRSEIKNRVSKEPEMVMAIIQEVMVLQQPKPSTKKPTTKARSLKAVS